MIFLHSLTLVILMTTTASWAQNDAKIAIAAKDLEAGIQALKSAGLSFTLAENYGNHGLDGLSKRQTVVDELPSANVGLQEGLVDQGQQEPLGVIVPTAEETTGVLGAPRPTILVQETSNSGLRR